MGMCVSAGAMAPLYRNPNALNYLMAKSHSNHPTMTKLGAYQMVAMLFAFYGTKSTPGALSLGIYIGW